MSLGTRLSASSALVAVLVVLSLSAALYATISHTLHRQLDTSLTTRARALAKQSGIGDFSSQLGDCDVLRLRGDLNLDRGGFLVLVDQRGRRCSAPAAAPKLGARLRTHAEVA